MTKKEFDKQLNAFVKHVNKNKKNLGLTDDVVVSTKLPLEEIETICESIGEEVSEACAEKEGGVPEDFITAYNTLNEAIGEYQESLDAANAESGQNDNPESGQNDTPTPEVKQEPKPIAPPAEPPKKRGPKPAGTKVKTAPKTKKSGGKAQGELQVEMDQGKAIKKMFDLLSPEDIAGLDPTTMRTILLTIK